MTRIIRYTGGKEQKFIDCGGGSRLVFKPNQKFNGQLVLEISDERVVKYLLNLPTYEVASDLEMERDDQAMKAAAERNAAAIADILLPRMIDAFPQLLRIHSDQIKKIASKG